MMLSTLAILSSLSVALCSVLCISDLPSDVVQLILGPIRLFHGCSIRPSYSLVSKFFASQFGTQFYINNPHELKVYQASRRPAGLPMVKCLFGRQEMTINCYGQNMQKLIIDIIYGWNGLKGCEAEQRTVLLHLFYPFSSSIVEHGDRRTNRIFLHELSSQEREIVVDRMDPRRVTDDFIAAIFKPQSVGLAVNDRNAALTGLSNIISSKNMWGHLTKSIVEYKLIKYPLSTEQDMVSMRETIMSLFKSVTEKANAEKTLDDALFHPKFNLGPFHI